MAETRDEGPKQLAAEAARDLARLKANIRRIDELTRRLVAAIASHEPHDPGLDGPGTDFYTRAAAAYFAEMLRNPSKLVEQQAGFWSRSLVHWLEAQEALLSGKPLPDDPTAKDRRFRDALWQTHPFFNFVRQQYRITAEALERTVDGLTHLPEADRQRIRFFTRQVIELMSPANYLATNPEALKKALETEGESLVAGLENLVRDLESHRGNLVVTLADPDAFEVGRNLATTEGAVVWQNRMLQLIQYAPTTERVHRTPLVIFPPWINKFYILDLRPENSLIRWIVDQGYTLFVVSWVNPDETYADVGIDTYLEEGFLAAVEQVKAITGEGRVNTIGYCIAGTLQAIALAWMAKKGDKSVRSATFFTALADFADPGEMGVFLADDFLSAIDREVEEKGYLDAVFMQRTFSFLRPADLVYGPAQRSYLMGEAPPAFDLLYWNGDSTNLPARLAHEYLHALCVENRLAEGRFEILGERLKLADIRTPITAIACETDHIARWQSSFTGLNRLRGPRQFILSESGHIAGIVNPPGRKKYGHYTNDAPMTDPETWKQGATFHEGSWWPRWERWLARRSGAMIPARQPGGPGHEVIEPAPGSYVKVRAVG